MLYQLSYAPIGVKAAQPAQLHGAKCDSSVSRTSRLTPFRCHPERARGVILSVLSVSS